MIRKNLHMIVTLIAVFVALSIGVGYYLGMSDALQVKERLEPIWPDIDTMEQHDRALLGALAMNCGLLRRENRRSETLDCLRSAANEERAKQLKADPSARLERLIERAAPANKG